MYTGGPGTGKSFASHSLRELFESLGWEHGVQFEVASMQAVVAAMLDGNTLHQTCSVSCGKRDSGANKKNKRNLRWLIIDEISQCSAELLGTCEIYTKNPMSLHGTYKLDPATSLERTWGGINVIFVGDFMQLPPAQQTALDTVPNSIMPIDVNSNQMKSKHGLSLIWEDVTHLVELKIQQRATDAWWMEVVNEIRAGNLTAVNHAFLHGHETEEAGCWSNVHRKCMEPCTQNCQTRLNECRECVEERKRRCRVYNSGEPQHNLL